MENQKLTSAERAAAEQLADRKETGASRQVTPEKLMSDIEYAMRVLQGHQKQNSVTLQKAAADEPIFVLRASDVYAVPTIMFWADMVRKFGGNRHKADMAISMARALEDYQKLLGAKKPD